MNKTDLLRYLKSLFRTVVLKGLLRYMLFPLICLLFLAGPIGSAVRASGPAAFLILFAALCCVSLNWTGYRIVCRKAPSLLVFAHGVFWVLVISVIEYEALPAYEPLASTLALICGALALTCLFLLSFWFAEHNTRPSRVMAVGLWIVIGIIAVFMLYRVIRDFEIRTVNADTWITVVILAALVPAACSRRILSACRGRSKRRRAAGLTEGKIIQIIGETRLDRDEDLVTDYHVRVEYTVDGTVYETRTNIAKMTMRWFGKQAFVGRGITVHYDPENPASAFTDRIDRHFFDRQEDEKEKQ